MYNGWLCSYSRKLGWFICSFRLHRLIVLFVFLVMLGCSITVSLNEWVRSRSMDGMFVKADWLNVMLMVVGMVQLMVKLMIRVVSDRTIAISVLALRLRLSLSLLLLSYRLLGL